MDAGRRDFNVFPVAEKTTKQPFRHRAAANITSTDEKDVFHDLARRRARLRNLKLNRIKSIRRALPLPNDFEDGLAKWFWDNQNRPVRLSLTEEESI
jgi:hypothetical protein